MKQVVGGLGDAAEVLG
eukprot:ctg_5802.g644